MRDFKINELNLDSKADILKRNISLMLSDFALPPALAAYVLKDIYMELETVRKNYVEKSLNDLQDRIREEETEKKVGNEETKEAQNT